MKMTCWTKGPLTLGIVACSLGAITAQADPWTGNGELGYVNVTGNTESETFTTKAKVTKEHGNWHHGAKINAIKSENEGEVQAESYEAGWRSEYSFTERFFGFGDIRYFDDKFDSFTEIYTGAIGLGYHIFNSDDLAWQISAGAGYRATDEIIIIEGPDPDSEDDDTELFEDIGSVSYLLESDYSQQLTESTKLENYTRVEIADDNTFSQNVTGLSVAINSTLALKLGYEVRHNSDPTPNFESTDRISTVTIVFNF